MSKVEYDDRVLLDSVCVKKGKEITPTDKTMILLCTPVLLDITSNDAFALAVVVVAVVVNITARVVVAVFVVVMPPSDL